MIAINKSYDFINQRAHKLFFYVPFYDQTYFMQSNYPIMLL